jgi:hypothetical protein
LLDSCAWRTPGGRPPEARVAGIGPRAGQAAPPRPATARLRGLARTDQVQGGRETPEGALRGGSERRVSRGMDAHGCEEAEAAMNRPETH